MTAATGVPGQPAAVPPPADPATLLRSRNYLGLLPVAAALSVPISAAAYFFLQLVALFQRWVFTDLPAALGFAGEPLWWPVPPLVLAGVLVGLTIRYLPGRGGESPAEGFKAGGGPAATRELPGIALAALASLSLGVVLGPEGPLIALGAGLAAAVFRLLRRNAPAQAVAVVGATGSFAAISTLLGSPLRGAFLLMEASGLGGATLDLVLVPGLLAAGLGTVIFIGLDSLTGLGAVSLALPGLPPFARPDVAQFGWALVIGVLAPLFGTGIRRLAVTLKPHVEDHLLLATPVAGPVIGALAVGYTAVTAEQPSDVLFSGQNQLGPLLAGSAGYSVWALLLLLVFKGLAYGVALSSFRGGPIFPAMFLGAAGGIVLSHLPGLPMVPAVAMGIGAMSVTMLRLPFTSVLLATLLLQADGLAVTPLVIVAVVVAHVVTARLTPAPSTAPPSTASSTGPPSKRPRPALLVLLALMIAVVAGWTALVHRDALRSSRRPFPGTVRQPIRRSGASRRASHEPVLGGGKVGRFNLEDEARRRGVTPTVLRRGDDLRALAEAAVAGWCAEPLIDVGVDGEALRLPPPLQFRSLPGALRVRTPLNAPGVSLAAAAPAGLWRAVTALLRVLAAGPPADLACRSALGCPATALGCAAAGLVGDAA